MTLIQGEAFLIIAVMLGLFAWGRLRYDLVALLALSTALIAGVVPSGNAFLGFANPVIIIIASVLVLSRAVAISGVVEFSIARLLRSVQSASAQIGVLTACVALLSAFMKNVGALGIFMPIAVQTAEREGRSASGYLMPLAFGSLIGGTITQIGTSPNLLISSVRQNLEGRPFSLFDFAPVGFPLTVLAIVFLSFGWRLIPKARTAQPSATKLLDLEDYLSEAAVPSTSPFIGCTVKEIEELSNGAVAVTAIVREGNRRYIPNGDWMLLADDILVLQAEPARLKTFLDSGQLRPVGDPSEVRFLDVENEIPKSVEAVVMAESSMVGSTSFDLHLRRHFQVNLLSVDRRGNRINTQLARIRFQVGDVVVLQGHPQALTDCMASLGCLPLGGSYQTSRHERPQLLPLIVLAIAMGSVLFKLAPVDVAFFIAAVLMVLLKQLTLKAAYEAIDWPIIVMLGSLIPVGEALRETGAAGLIGSGLTIVAAHLPGGLAVGLVLTTTMLMTPFLHHAAATIVMGPIAAVLASNLGFAPDAFLMAVALGASCDFLTPIGHQNNMLVMGPGGYRFGDYRRLGLPLSCLVVVVGTELILLAWPLR